MPFLNELYPEILTLGRFPTGHLAYDSRAACAGLFKLPGFSELFRAHVVFAGKHVELALFANRTGW